MRSEARRAARRSWTVDRTMPRNRARCCRLRASCCCNSNVTNADGRWLTSKHISTSCVKYGSPMVAQRAMRGQLTRCDCDGTMGGAFVLFSLPRESHPNDPYPVQNRSCIEDSLCARSLLGRAPMALNLAAIAQRARSARRSRTTRARADAGARVPRGERRAPRARARRARRVRRRRPRARPTGASSRATPRAGGSASGSSRRRRPRARAARSAGRPRAAAPARSRRRRPPRRPARSSRRS